MWLNSIKKKRDPSNNNSSQHQREIQHQSVSQTSMRQVQTTSQFREALTEMKDISKSSYDSARNMEKLTIIIATLTLTSLAISLMGLTISAVNEVAQTSSGLTINLAWALGVLVTVVCLFVITIILERGEYVPQTPHLSHIKRYKKYCRSRLISSIVIDGLLYVFGIIFAFTSFITYITNDFSVIMRTDWLLAIGISLVILTVIIIGIGIYQKYRPHIIYFAGGIPLIITLLIWLAYTSHIVLLIQQGLIVILLLYWIVVCLVSAYYLIKSVTLFLDSNTTLDDWYEYKSDKAHTSIVVVIDQHRYVYLADNSVKRLAKHYMNDLKQPYRVYFCFKKEQVINILEKDTVNDILIFGYLTDNCGNPIHSGMDYSNSGLVDSKFHGKTFDQILYSKKKVKSLIHAWEKEQESLED